MTMVINSFSKCANCDKKTRPREGVRVYRDFYREDKPSLGFVILFCSMKCLKEYEWWEDTPLEWLKKHTSEYWEWMWEKYYKREFE